MDQTVHTLTLDKQSSKSSATTAGPLVLTICITPLDEDEKDCYLTTVHFKGTPEADGMNVELKKVGDMWVLKKKRTIAVEDEDENEIEFMLQEVVVKVPEEGAESARAKIDVRDGEILELATGNWELGLSGGCVD